MWVCPGTRSGWAHVVRERALSKRSGVAQTIHKLATRKRRREKHWANRTAMAKQNWNDILGGQPQPCWLRPKSGMAGISFGSLRVVVATDDPTLDPTPVVNFNQKSNHRISQARLEERCCMLGRWKKALNSAHLSIWKKRDMYVGLLIFQPEIPSHVAWAPTHPKPNGKYCNVWLLVVAHSCFNPQCKRQLRRVAVAVGWYFAYALTWRWAPPGQMSNLILTSYVWLNAVEHMLSGCYAYVIMFENYYKVSLSAAIGLSPCATILKHRRK